VFENELRLVVPVRGSGVPRSEPHGESDLDGHLPLMHFAAADLATRFDHLEPTQVFDGFVGALNGIHDSVLNG
jgi:hypothetical protein